jgi:hypothetical protein
LQSVVKPDEVLLKVLNRYEQIYRQASMRFLSSSNELVRMASLNIMLKTNSLLFETAVLPELMGRLRALEDKAAKGGFCALKPWQKNRKVANLAIELDDSAKSETRIDINCLTEPERALFERVQEIIDKYAPGCPPQDVIENKADLWYKGLEIFGRRAAELFVVVVPASFCCDELETWYFKLYFYNFWLDWLESIEQVRKMPKEQREALLFERREMGMLDRVFRFSRSQPETIKNQKKAEDHPK